MDSDELDRFEIDNAIGGITDDEVLDELEFTENFLDI